jgi:putative N6-adenine-specific DNA methylase
LIAGASLSVLQEVSLIDPMAGSGTLLSEAGNLYQTLNGRSFAFQEQNWIPKILKSPSFFANYRHQPARTWKQLVAADLWPDARARLQELSSSLKDRLLVLEKVSDFQASGPCWVVANPPYGERLKAIPTEELRDLLLAPKPERVAVILPERMALALQKAWPSGYRVESKPVSNGGIACRLLRFLKKI